MSKRTLPETLPLFESIDHSDLKVLLPCINARVVGLKAGSSFDISESKEDHVYMVLSGTLTDGRNKLSEGSVLTGDTTSDTDGVLTSLTDASLLKMNRDMIYSPCWFSCSFHHRLLENLEGMIGS